MYPQVCKTLAENSETFRLMKAMEMKRKKKSFMGRRQKESICLLLQQKTKKNNRNTFSKWVQCVNHELEDAVPHQTVVERCRASSPLEPWLGLGGKIRGNI